MSDIRKRIEAVRDIIASSPADSLGTGQIANYSSDPPSLHNYPIRDEVVSELTRILDDLEN